MVEFGLLVKIWSVPTRCIYKIRCVPKIQVRKKTYPWEGTHTEYLIFVSAGVDVAVWSAAADSVAGGVGEVEESSIRSLVVVVEEIIVAAETVVEDGGGVSVVIDSVDAVVVCIMVTLLSSLKNKILKWGWEKTRGGLMKYLSGSGKPFSNNSCSVSIYTSSKKKKNKTKQNKTKQNKTKQNKTKQNKTKQNKTKQNKTKQNKTKQNNNNLKVK